MTGVDGTEIFEKLLPACCRNRRYNGLDRHNRCWMVRRGTSLLRKGSSTRRWRLAAWWSARPDRPRIVLGGRVKGTTKIAPVQGFCSSVAASLKNGNTRSWVSTATRPPLGTTSAATGAPTLPLPKSVEQVQDGRDVPAPAAAREHAAPI